MSSKKGRRLRRGLLLVHLWCGLGLGLYLVVLSVSGSVIVYRNELRAAFQPQPRIVEERGPRLSEEALIAAGETAFPEH